MSMIMQWDGVPAAETDRLRSLSEEDFCEWLDAPEGRLSFDVDKAWQAVHFALTGDPWSTAGPFGAVVLGGDEFGDDLGYGPPRLLAAPVVAELARSLDALDPETFADRVDLAALTSNDVYPDIWDRTDEDLIGYVADGYARVRAGFAEAAAAGLALVVSLV